MTGETPAVQIVDELLICRAGRCGGYPSGPYADYAEALSAAKAHWASVHWDHRGIVPTLVRTYAPCVVDDCEREGRRTYGMCHLHSEEERRRRAAIRHAEQTAYEAAHPFTFIPSAAHGEVRGYGAGCRCSECKRAMADYRRERRALKAGAA